MIDFLSSLFSTLWNILNLVLNISIVNNFSFGDLLVIVIICGTGLKFLFGGRGD